jgi:hypothetical protein
LTNEKRKKRFSSGIRPAGNFNSKAQASKV